MPDDQLVVSIRDVEKNYRSLRPLRIRQLDLHRGETVALLGLDRGAAEVLVNVITGASVPDAGTVVVFGTSTRDIVDADAWLKAMDRFGILSERVVLLDAFTVEQNLVLPFSVDVHQVSDELRARVQRLAREAGIGAADLAASPAALSEHLRQRIRLAKALALDPQLVLAEHPTATLEATDALAFGGDLRRISTRRGMTMLVVTADAELAHRVADRVLELQPATGELRASQSPAVRTPWNGTWIRLLETIRRWSAEGKRRGERHD